MPSSDLDHLGRPVVAVTGVGLVTSLGRGVADNWTALTAGRSGIHTITRFPTDNLRTTIAGTVDFMNVEPWSGIDLSYALAEAAGREAIQQSGLPDGDFAGPLFLAAPPIELEWSQRLYLDGLPGEAREEAGYDRLLDLARSNRSQSIYDLTLFGGISERLSDELGTRGLPVTLSTACASGASAIQLGVEAIRRGETERCIAIGTDGSVGAEALIRFSLLSALSTQNAVPERASKPFSRDRDGFVMAEGAGALVLESLSAARARGATVLGVLLGVGEKADDFHRTRSKPDGSPIIATLRAGLADAGLRPEDIGYINAHGTSTPENDRMEYSGLAAVFGENIQHTPISSSKSMIGHTLTAAGAIEAVISILAMREGVLPPTINYDQPDPAIPLDTVPHTARSADVSAVLSNSFGFGGQNVSLVLGREPRA
ncbi:beta-ketoacyl-ACP synthase [Aureimonas jatrophae]|uniref:3-oxoacyl-[acyl-carrier-protein] synthase II n=1 Tax=Aureimonas jatrophae TaxID=1166073 RepID=A0A1H0GDC6_9HYPH|nr:beta-ketoacyl-ACP synthase [Aureimonas jatrophae]MBB3949518.1 3-oxoacyl-[acyl-carrier-protein] synthase II [Aureimonas jatrophae]SDO04864.1 3-oxoacyl-[acyl-carrier-protein] synthase II [Aureimonas jatrophae]